MALQQEAPVVDTAFAVYWNWALVLIEESDHGFLGLPGKYFLHVKPHERVKEGETVHVIFF